MKSCASVVRFCRNEGGVGNAKSDILQGVPGSEPSEARLCSVACSSDRESSESPPAGGDREAPSASAEVLNLWSGVCCVAIFACSFSSDTAGMDVWSLVCFLRRNAAISISSRSVTSSNRAELARPAVGECDERL